MAIRESDPDNELLCVTCPNRGVLSRGLARVGLTETNSECPGPDTVDRFAVIAIPDGRMQPPPPDYTYESSRGSLRYYSTPPQREVICPQEPILIGKDEAATDILQNVDGRIWITIGEGAPGVPNAASIDLDIDRRYPMFTRLLMEELRVIRTVGEESDKSVAE